MKRAAAFLALVAVGCANLPMDAPRSLADAETAFAAHSVREDMRVAFLANFAEDGVFVRKGWVTAKPALEKQTPPAFVLDWHPVYTEVARSGEIGLSTGPWKITSKTKPDEPPTFGQFVSVWRRNAAGQWQVAVDLGIDHPHAELWSAPLETRWAKEGPVPADTLAAAEERFETSARVGGIQAAHAQFAADDIRFYRSGSAPVIGKVNALGAASMREHPDSWTVERMEVARSNDFGYVRGSYSARTMPGRPGGYFLRVWRVERGDWRIVLDVTNPRAT